jgi:hypothetical protein
MVMRKKNTSVLSRKYFVAYKHPEVEQVYYLGLNAENYDDALNLARCVVGNKAKLCLVYEDFADDD